MSDYTPKVDDLFLKALIAKFTVNDFAELAMAALDQAGMSVAGQEAVRLMLRTDRSFARIEALS